MNQVESNMHNESLKIEHTNLAEKVYTRIIEAILDGTFSAGERLMCNDIAKQFGVSRTPVREALVRLEKEEFLHSAQKWHICK